MFPMSPQIKNAKLIHKALMAGLEIYASEVGAEKEDTVRVLEVNNDGRLVSTDSDGIKIVYDANLKSSLEEGTDKYYISDTQGKALAEWSVMSDFAVDLRLLEANVALFGDMDYQPDFGPGDYIVYRKIEEGTLELQGGPNDNQLIYVRALEFQEGPKCWYFYGYTTDGSRILPVRGECWRMEKVDPDKYRNVPLPK